MFIKKYIADVSSVSQDDFNHLFKTLPLYRQKKINEYKLDKDKYLSLLTGLTLKEAFIEIGYPNLDEKVLFTKEGKPYLPSEYNLYLSISHSYQKVLVVISDHNLGCDIEYIKDKDNLSLAKRYFTDKEYNYIVNNTNPNQSFYKMWTIKESYLKAIGTGLLTPLNSIEINLDNLEISNKDYIVNESYVKDGYSVAIVVKK